MRSKTRRPVTWYTLTALLLWMGAGRAPAETATVTGVPQIYLRTGPGTTFVPDGVVVEGETVETMERSGSWMRVKTADGRVGYVYAGYLGARGAVGTMVTPAAPAAPTEIPPPLGIVPVATPVPTSPPDASSEALRTEVASLRHELESLKDNLASRESRPGPPSSGAPADLATAPALSEDEAAGVRLLGVAALFLVIGFVAGTTVGGRRGRSQRTRLRY